MNAHDERIEALVKLTDDVWYGRVTIEAAHERVGEILAAPKEAGSGMREALRQCYVELSYCARQLEDRGCRLPERGAVKTALALGKATLESNPPGDQRQEVCPNCGGGPKTWKCDGTAACKAASPPPEAAATNPQQIGSESVGGAAAVDPFPSLREFAAECMASEDIEPVSDFGRRLQVELDLLTGDDIAALIHARMEYNIALANGDDAAALSPTASAALASPTGPQPAGGGVDDAMVYRAARVLSDRQADECNINRDDTWKVYSESFAEDARAMLLAAIKGDSHAG